VGGDQPLGSAIAGIDHGVLSGIVLMKSLDLAMFDDEGGQDDLRPRSVA